MEQYSLFPNFLKAIQCAVQWIAIGNYGIQCTWLRHSTKFDCLNCLSDRVLLKTELLRNRSYILYVQPVSLFHTVKVSMNNFEICCMHYKNLCKCARKVWIKPSHSDFKKTLKEIKVNYQVLKLSAKSNRDKEGAQVRIKYCFIIIFSFY